MDNCHEILILKDRERKMISPMEIKMNVYYAADKKKEKGKRDRNGSSCDVRRSNLDHPVVGVEKKEIERRGHAKRRLKVVMVFTKNSCQVLKPYKVHSN
ncbi:hypothetical protein M0804_010838 [Polistes exclamans]|nr:hypothetical protein M0804_010838 [Polistes exclamans]